MRRGITTYVAVAPGGEVEVVPREGFTVDDVPGLVFYDTGRPGRPLACDHTEGPNGAHITRAGALRALREHTGDEHRRLTMEAADRRDALLEHERTLAAIAERLGFDPASPHPALPDLDPGIADLVHFLRARGFDTTDSGDGWSKRGGPMDGEGGCVMPCPHVVVCTDPALLLVDAERLVMALCDYVAMEGKTLPGDVWTVEATFLPGGDPGSGRGVLLASGPHLPSPPAHERPMPGSPVEGLVWCSSCGEVHGEGSAQGDGPCGADDWHALALR